MLPSSLQRLAGIESQDGEYRFSDLLSSAQDDEVEALPPAAVPATLSGADARKRKKREQRKAHKAAQAQPHVQWGSVDAFYFSHVVGGSAVPSKGIYPISLGGEVEDLRVSMSLDEHISQTQSDLLHRAQALGLQIPLVKDAAAAGAASVPIPIPKPGKSSKSSSDSAATPITSSASSLTPPPPGHAYAPLETRQFDYRRGQHNQLFSALTEEERRLVLVDLETWGGASAVTHSTPPRGGAASSLEKRAAALGDGDSKTPPRGADSRKARSNSATSATDTGSPGLSGSAPAAAASTHHVAEHHREIKAIQKSRSEHLGTTTPSLTLPLGSLSPVSLPFLCLAHSAVHRNTVVTSPLPSTHTTNTTNTGCSCKAIKVDKLSVVKMKETYAQVCGSLGGFEAASAMASQAEAQTAGGEEGTEKDGQTSEEAARAADKAAADSPPRPLSKAQVELLSKADLAATLREVLKFCALCTRDCECLQLGIGCSGETCGCLRREVQRAGSLSVSSISSISGSSGSSGGDSDSSSSGGLALLPNQGCGNPYGRQLFDQETVNAYRKRVLASLHNGVINRAAFEAYQG